MKSYGNKYKSMRIISLEWRMYYVSVQGICSIYFQQLRLIVDRTMMRINLAPSNVNVEETNMR